MLPTCVISACLRRVSYLVTIWPWLTRVDQFATTELQPHALSRCQSPLRIVTNCLKALLARVRASVDRAFCGVFLRDGIWLVVSRSSALRNLFSRPVTVV